MNLPRFRYDQLREDHEPDISRKNKAFLFRLISLTGILVCSVILWYFSPFAKYNSLALEQSLSIPYKQQYHPEAPSPLWGVITKPFPSGAFFTNMVVENGDGPVAVIPYGVKTIESGIQVSYGPTRRFVSEKTMIDAFTCDLELSSSEAYQSRSITAWDNSSVTVEYKIAGGKMRSPFVKGAPFVTVFYENATPVIRADVAAISNLEARFIKDSTSTQYIITLGNYQKWLIYCSEPVLFIWKESSIVSTTKFPSLTIRVAFLPSQNVDSSYNTLMKYISCIPVGVKHEFLYPTPTTVQQSLTFDTVNEGELLMFALPHHIDFLKVPDKNIDEIALINKGYYPVYYIKGILSGLVGKKWVIEFPLTNVGWNYASSNGLTTEQLDEIGTNLMLDVKSIKPTAQTPYTFGKQVGRMARLALIADELGIAEARQLAVSTMEESLIPWLSNQNSNPFVYDKTWGGIVVANSLLDKLDEFSSGWYADHHFHYGYFVYAFASLIKLKPTFYDKYKSAMDVIVYDICSVDPSSMFFPFMRHKDLFDGHSWASGLFQYSNSKSQESSSEVLLILVLMCDVYHYHMSFSPFFSSFLFSGYQCILCLLFIWVVD